LKPCHCNFCRDKGKKPHHKLLCMNLDNPANKDLREQAATSMRSRRATTTTSKPTIKQERQPRAQRAFKRKTDQPGPSGSRPKVKAGVHLATLEEDQKFLENFEQGAVKEEQDQKNDEDGLIESD
jgi:hypothetical protein